MRALVARFWDEPYERRWCAGAPALHDRFMLPHFVAADFADVLADLQRAGYRLRARLVRAVPRVPLPAARRGRPSAASSSSCARRSSRGTCWARRRRPAAPRATSTRSVERLQVHGQRRDRPAGTSSPATACRCRCTRPARPARRSPACASGPGQPPSALHPTHRRPRAAGVRHRRHAGAAARWAAAPITSPIRAAATTTLSRSTPTRPRPARRPVRGDRPHARADVGDSTRRSTPSTRSRSTCAASGSDRREPSGTGPS